MIVKTFKKWWKMKKKCHLKNKKAEHVLLYHFLTLSLRRSLSYRNQSIDLRRTASIMKELNDKYHTQLVSPGKKKLIQPHMLKHEWKEESFALLIFVYTRRKKTWINFFKLFINY